MLYSAIFILLCISSYICDFANRKKYVLPFTFISVFILSLLSGLSYEIGSDTIPYMLEYESASGLFDLSVSDFYVLNRQPGWILLESAFKSLQFGFPVFKLFQAFFLNFSVWSFLKKNTSYVATCLLVYYFSVFFPINFETMRESFAVAVFLLGFNTLKDKQYGRYYVVCLIALSFHISALILFALPLVHLFHVNKKIFSWAFLLMLALILLTPHLYLDTSLFSLLMNEKLAENAYAYLGSKAASLSIVYILLFCFKYFVIYKGINEFKVDSFFYSLLLLSFVLGILSRSIPILYRFERFVSVSEIVCLSGSLITLMIPKKASINRRYSKGIRFFVAMITLSILSFSTFKGYFATNPETGDRQIDYYYPYRSIISK